MVTSSVLFAACAIPAIYYLLVLYSAGQFSCGAKRREGPNTNFTPPVSCLKPIKGLDVDAYENYASFCRQDYPEYEIVFCVDPGDPALPVLEKLVRDFPERKIRLLFGSGRNAINDKVGRLVRLTTEAQYDIFVITDGDVRVQPDYLRRVVAPLRNPKVGGVTCLYSSIQETTFLQELQSVGMISDFFAGIMVAWKLDGVKFAFGQTIVLRRKSVERFGGFQAIENLPADDLLTGRLTEEQGYEVRLLPCIVQTSPDFESFGGFFHKRLRWMTEMRLMRPWGHFGLVFTWGLPWALAAVMMRPRTAVALAYLGTYLALRVAMTWMIGAMVMKQIGMWRKMPLIPVWDALAFLIWLASFARKSIRWRGVDYLIRDGRLAASAPAPAVVQNASR